MLYWLVRKSLRLYMTLFHRFRATGTEYVPREGPCIIAANHQSYLDPVAITCGARHRIVHYLARQSLWEHSRFSRWFFSRFYCMPVDRNRGDIAAFRRVLHTLGEGKVVGLFPEGTRSPDGQLQTPKAGVGFLVARAGVPVVPAYIEGTHAALPKNGRGIRPVRVRIAFGPPIQPDELPRRPDRPRPDPAEVSQLVMSRIAALRDRALKAGVQV